MSTTSLDSDEFSISDDSEFKYIPGHYLRVIETENQASSNYGEPDENYKQTTFLDVEPYTTKPNADE